MTISPNYRTPHAFFIRISALLIAVIISLPIPNVWGQDRPANNSTAPEDDAWLEDFPWRKGPNHIRCASDGFEFQLPEGFRYTTDTAACATLHNKIFSTLTSSGKAYLLSADRQCIVEFEVIRDFRGEITAEGQSHNIREHILSDIEKGFQSINSSGSRALHVHGWASTPEIISQYPPTIACAISVDSGDKTLFSSIHLYRYARDRIIVVTMLSDPSQTRQNLGIGRALAGTIQFDTAVPQILPPPAPTSPAKGDDSLDKTLTQATPFFVAIFTGFIAYCKRIKNYLFGEKDALSDTFKISAEQSDLPPLPFEEPGYRAPPAS